jgi:hypothetical protein
MSLNKEISNIPLDVDLMGITISKLRPECFNGIYWNFVLCKVRSHGVKKRKDKSCN